MQMKQCLCQCIHVAPLDQVGAKALGTNPIKRKLTRKIINYEEDLFE